MSKLLDLSDEYYSQVNEKLTICVKHYINLAHNLFWLPLPFPNCTNNKRPGHFIKKNITEKTRNWAGRGKNDSS